MIASLPATRARIIAMENRTTTMAAMRRNRNKDAPEPGWTTAPNKIWEETSQTPTVTAPSSREGRTLILEGGDEWAAACMISVTSEAFLRFNTSPFWATSEK